MPPVTFSKQSVRASQRPRIAAVIPARYESTRFPGKPLADLAGKPMIEHVYQRAADTRGIDAVVVATDDERIAEAVARFGGVARMTSADHRSGTDRAAEIARDLDCDLVVNVQGDEPLIEPAAIRQAVEPLLNDADVHMATLRRRLHDAAEVVSPHVVKVVVDRHGDALYFSRAPVPFARETAGGQLPAHTAVFKHIGLYVYRRDFLLAVTSLSPTPLELAESLEQLRVLEHGYRIRVVETDYDSIGVDTPEDLERVRRHVLAATRA